MNHIYLIFRITEKNFDPPRLTFLFQLEWSQNTPVVGSLKVRVTTNFYQKAIDHKHPRTVAFQKGVFNHSPTLSLLPVFPRGRLGLLGLA